MLAKAMRFFWVLIVLLACGDDSSPTDSAVDTGTATDGATPPADQGADLGAQDGSTEDAAVDATAEDASSDASSVDSAVEADASTDAGNATDSGTPDLGADSGACMYLDDLFITDCDTGFERFRHFVDRSNPDACPEYFVLRGNRYDTLGDAFDTEGCRAECLRAPANSVTLLRCGRRTGFISFEDLDGCVPDSVIETPDGIFRDSAEWNEAAPCE